MLRLVDSLIDRLTMYKLVLYYLIALLLIAMGLSQLGYMHYQPLHIAVSAIILVIAAWAFNQFFFRTLQIPASTDSTHITALILALIITPVNSKTGLVFLVAAAGLATASKYLLTIKRKHIFNPAAVAVALTSLGAHQTASWWVGTKPMLPFVIIGGLLVARKIRRGRMIVSFLASTTVATIVYSLIAGSSVIGSLDKTVVSSAVFFLAFVMLTEPASTPPTSQKQVWYGTFAGILFPPQFHLFGVYSTPELDLVVSNIFSYLISPKIKLLPRLKAADNETPNVIDFVFRPDQRLAYQAGQYMEWTLPHDDVDSRGDRRMFTLASSPTESDIRIGVKFYEKSSSFKKALLSINRASPIVASQLAGDFTLPKDKNRKIVFIAGGIGVTPYRSMIKYLTDTNERRDIVLLYSANSVEDLAYRQIFEDARQKIGTKVIYHITGSTSEASSENIVRSRITSESIKKEVPDYLNRLFYVSGNQNMISSVRQSLLSIGVHRKNIKTDLFSGYSG